MILTWKYIGNQFEKETFPIMRLSIEHFGIDNSLWASRILMYSYFFVALIKANNIKWLYFLVIITILYYTAMIPWLYTLGYVT
jgi:hypothetical protein